MSGATMVIGGAGFVGAHLARALLHRGRDVVTFDLAPEPPEMVREAAGRAGLSHLRSDFTDPGQLVEGLLEHGVGDVVLTAALLSEPESIERPRQFLRVNAEAVWQLCDVARHVPGVRRLVMVSTRSVYGEYGPEEGPLTEEHAPRPVAFYGAAKAAADLVVALYRRHYGLDAVSARITGVYGPFQNYGHPLSTMVDDAVAGRPHLRPNGGDYPYEFTYVKDVVRGLLALLDAPALQHAVYNIGSGVQHRLGEVAALVRESVHGAEIEIGPGLGERPPRAAMSVERARSELGYEPVWSLRAGVEEHVSWKRDGSYGAPIEAAGSEKGAAR